MNILIMTSFSFAWILDAASLICPCSFGLDLQHDRLLQALPSSILPHYKPIKRAEQFPDVQAEVSSVGMSMMCGRRDASLSSIVLKNPTIVARTAILLMRNMQPYKTIAQPGKAMDVTDFRVYDLCNSALIFMIYEKYV